MYPEVAIAGQLPADLDHAWALIEPGHARAAADQFPGVQPRTARGVEDQLAGDVAEQVQARGPVIVGVVKAGLGVPEELVGELVILRLASHLCVHACHRPAPWGEGKSAPSLLA